MDKEKQNWLRHKVIRILTLRDHSEKELRQKLKKDCSDQEIRWALEFAAEFRLIPKSAEEQLALAQRYQASFQRQLKGSQKLKQTLLQKGLPVPPDNPEQELENALAYLDVRCSKSQKSLTKPQLIRYLLNRGFSLATAMQALRQYKPK